MRNSSKYLRLWQQKRSELHISDDMQTGWLEMQGLLDEHMPLTQPDNLYPTEELTHLAKFKWLYLLATAIVITAIVYFTLHHPVKTETGKHHKTEFKKDSTANNPTSQTLNPANAPDSTAGNINTENNHTSAINTANGKSSTVAIKTNTLAAIKSSTNPVGNKANPNGQPEINGNVNLSGNKSTKPGNNRTTNISSVNTIINSRLNAVGSINSSGVKRYDNMSSLYSRQTSVHTATGHSLSGHGNRPLTGPGKTEDKYNPNSSVQTDINKQTSTNQLQSLPSELNFNWNPNTSPLIVITDKNNKTAGGILLGKTTGDKKTKPAKITNPKASGMDWGILAGINSPGSFTAKSQNANIYGSLPVDVFVGLFTTYNLNNKWAVGSQLRLLNPHTVNGSYTHKNESKIDTNQTLQINDSRKIYTVDIPLHVAYNVNPNFSVKAGPVISIPVKQVNGNSTFQTKTRKDSSAYYSTVTNAINNTGFDKKINYGISGGVSLHVNRLLFDATYYYGLQTQKISSSLGGYTTNTNGLQLTIGFKLNKTKR